MLSNPTGTRKKKLFARAFKAPWLPSRACSLRQETTQKTTSLAGTDEHPRTVPLRFDFVACCAFLFFCLCVCVGVSVCVYISRIVFLLVSSFFLFGYRFIDFAFVSTSHAMGHGIHLPRDLSSLI